jgi:CYTH domain-containing protein
MLSKNSGKPLKYARIETERRFLLESIPEDLQGGESFTKIIDHYIPGIRLRLRRIESASGETLVFKFGQKYQAANFQTQQTIMTNIYLNETEYRTIQVLGGPTITKRRYKYPYDGDDYSIDVFEGHLKGLILAEIESRAEREINKLPMPPFAIREVTGDPKFTGGELVKLSEEEFQRWMEAW